jgi:hypothetical protein
MNRGRLHAGKEGSGTLGGKAGRSRDGNSWYWHPLLLCAITWVLSLSPVSSFAVSPAIPSNRLPPQSPPPPTQASPPAHSITTIESRLACGVSASTASQVAGGMCVQLGDSLDTAGSAETAAILLTGGFVEMQAQAQGMTTLLACIYHVPKYPPVSDDCDEAKDGTGI